MQLVYLADSWTALDADTENKAVVEVVTAPVSDAEAEEPLLAVPGILWLVLAIHFQDSEPKKLKHSTLFINKLYISLC